MESTINLFGGSITDCIKFGNIINVFGYDLAKTDTGGTYGHGQITGFWQDGLQFTIDLYADDSYSRLNLIPEPASFGMIILGAAFVRLRNPAVTGS
jgi:hypothetical protein